MKDIKMSFGDFYINTPKKQRGCTLIKGRTFVYDGVAYGVRKCEDKSGYTLTHLKSGAYVGGYQYLREIKEDIKRVTSLIKKEWREEVGEISLRFQKLLYEHYENNKKAV